MSRLGDVGEDSTQLRPHEPPLTEWTPQNPVSSADGRIERLAQRCLLLVFVALLVELARTVSAMASPTTVLAQPSDQYRIAWAVSINPLRATLFLVPAVATTALVFLGIGILGVRGRRHAQAPSLQTTTNED